MIKVTYNEATDKLTVYTDINDPKIHIASSAALFVNNNVITGYEIKKYSKNLVNKYFEKFLGKVYNK